MILGERCTRGCGFCSVQKLNPKKHDVQLDANEPANVARMAREMKLRYVVITSVNRDDLEDGGSHHFAETVREVRRALPEARVEVLTPDFCGDLDAVARVLDAGPARVQSQHGDGAAAVLAGASAGGLPAVAGRAGVRAALMPRQVLTKSGFMVGLGETPDEVRTLLRDLRAAGTDVATIGQYLQPTRRNLPVAEFVEPRQFDAYREYGLALGFKAWCSADRWCAVPTWPIWSARKRSGSRAELAAGAGFGGAAHFYLSEILHRLVCAGGAGAAAGGHGARAALAAPLPAGLGRGRGVLVRRLLLDSVRALLSRRAGGRGGLGGVPVVLRGEGAPHGRVRRAGRNPDAALVGRAVGGGAVGGGGSDARVARLRVAGAGQRRNRYGDPDAPGAVHRRLRAFVRVRHDGGGAGAGGDRGGRGWNCSGWRRFCF